MSKESVLLAKVAALKKNFDGIDYGMRNRCYGKSVEPLFPRYLSAIKELKELNPMLYNDIPDLQIPKEMGQTPGDTLYFKSDIDPLVQNLDYILEFSANVRIGDNIIEREKTQRVFISHGRSNEWTKIQNYLEKVLGIPTLELAQEANLGRTVSQKLIDAAAKCSVAAIVMTGDDTADGGEIRARENVIHEIGYFQGRYGTRNVILLHEHGVNIPSNFEGIVYIGFPKDSAEAAQGALTREMKVLFEL